MKKLSVIFAVLFLLMAAPAVHAADTAPTPIYTVDEFLAMEESGSYILMADLDLAGMDWPCPSFSGVFDGNGHAILNLYLSQPGTETATSYDGNLKEYDTKFAGLFGILKDAEIKNLQLLGVQGLVEQDCPVFVGALAGCALDSTFTNCTVSANLELRAFDRMFGIGGMIGYGSGTVTDCTLDVTLICTDTDPENRDEQFMGGVFSTGFMDVTGCDITIDGYSSEYGYAHNGGITGMYMQRPLGDGYDGKLTGNSVTGKITFFEKNTDRRAYCKAEAGEVLASRVNISGNTTNFNRDERKEYDKELRPEMCETPAYESEVIAPGCDTYGYSEHTCSGCGYAYRDAYTLFAHTVSNWEIVEAATTEKEGLSEGKCDLCQAVVSRTEPVMEEQPTEGTHPQPQGKPVPTQPEAGQDEADEDLGMMLWLLGIGAAALALLIIVLLMARNTPQGKFAKKK